MLTPPDHRFLIQERDRAAAKLAKAEAALADAMAFRCKQCQRTLANNLTLAEARDQNGTGEAACMLCLLTDVLRDPPALSQRENAGA